MTEVTGTTQEPTLLAQALDACEYYSGRLAAISEALATMQAERKADPDAPFSINEALKERKRMTVMKAQLADVTKRLNTALDDNEYAVKAFLHRENLQNCVVSGLYRASLVTKSVYTGDNNFKLWAMQNDPSCLTITPKQTGITAYRDDNEGKLPDGVKETKIVSVSFTTAK